MALNRGGTRLRGWERTWGGNCQALMKAELWRGLLMPCCSCKGCQKQKKKRMERRSKGICEVSYETVGGGEISRKKGVQKLDESTLRK